MLLIAKLFQGYAAARGLALSKTYKFITLQIFLAVWQLFCVRSASSRPSRLRLIAPLDPQASHLVARLNLSDFPPARQHVLATSHDSSR